MTSNPQTPPRQQGPINQETPVYSKSVHGSLPYQSGKLNDAKLAVLNDLGQHVPEVTFQDFLDYLAPSQPTFNLEATMETLKADPEGIIPATGRWKAFDSDPKDKSRLEDVVFAPIPNIFDTVVRAIIANSDLTSTHVSVLFLQNPSIAPTSSARQNATRPDGYMVLKEGFKEGHVSWDNILLSCEYKRMDGENQLNDVSIRVDSE
jgi:hypothetical protein